MQGLRRGEHLPAQSAKEPVQGLRRGDHLPAQSAKEHMQGVRRGDHLPAQSAKEQVQDVQSRQGRVDAAGSREAVDVTLTGFRSPVCASVLTRFQLQCKILHQISRNSEDVAVWTARVLL